MGSPSVRTCPGPGRTRGVVRGQAAETCWLSVSMSTYDGARAFPPRSRRQRNTTRIGRPSGQLAGFPACDRSNARTWPCPAITDTSDRLKGLGGADGGERQTAPVLPGRIQARGGRRGLRRGGGGGGGG